MTNYSFYPAIPAANNNPSNDQPLMQTSNQSVNDLISEDHVTFNVSNGGLHKQIRFNANNVPADAPTFPTLFTNTSGGSSQLFFYTGTASQGKNQYVPTNSTGSCLLLGGTILKWGSFTQSSSTTSVSYGVAFPNATLSVVLTANNQQARNTPGQVQNFSTGGFDCVAGSTTGVYYYIAIGY